LVRNCRQIIILVFVLTMVAGCGSTGQSPKTTSGAAIDQAVEKKNLLVYSGAGLRKPMDELGKMFQEKTGVTIQYTYAGSAQCVNQILTTDKGDVFLPGDSAELKAIIEKDMVNTQKPVVLHVPVLAVPKGNPAGIAKLEDLIKPNVKIALGDPKANPIGKLSDEILMDKGILEKVEKNVTVRTATANEPLTYLTMRQVDAAIIWEDNMVGNENVELLDIPDFNRYIKTVPAAVLKCAAEPELAAEFADFVSSQDALKIWEKWGFKPADR